MKECATSCETAACNLAMDGAASMFSGSVPQSECYSCTYIVRNTGDVAGNKFCADEPDKLEDGSVSCPMYANAACYTGTSAHYVRAQI